MHLKVRYFVFSVIPPVQLVIGWCKISWSLSDWLLVHCSITKGCKEKNLSFQKTVLALEGEPFVLRGCPSHSL